MMRSEMTDRDLILVAHASHNQQVRVLADRLADRRRQIDAALSYARCTKSDREKLAGIVKTLSEN